VTAPPLKRFRRSSISTSIVSPISDRQEGLAVTKPK
jgi:hypothetical protein